MRYVFIGTYICSGSFLKTYIIILMFVLRSQVLQDCWLASTAKITCPRDPDLHLTNTRYVQHSLVPIFCLFFASWSPLLPSHNLVSKEDVTSTKCLESFLTGIFLPCYSKICALKSSHNVLQGLKESSIQDHKLEQVDKLKKIAEEIGATLPQLAIAWAARNPNVSVVLLGATKEAQVTIKFLNLIEGWCLIESISEAKFYDIKFIRTNLAYFHASDILWYTRQA